MQEKPTTPTSTSRVIIDIDQMPGYEYREGFKGLKSVTEGKIFLKWYECGLYPTCYRHGAILKIGPRQDGAIWRCREEGCDEGCFEKTN